MCWAWGKLPHSPGTVGAPLAWAVAADKLHPASAATALIYLCWCPVSRHSFNCVRAGGSESKQWWRGQWHSPSIELCSPHGCLPASSHHQGCSYLEGTCLSFPWCPSCSLPPPPAHTEMGVLCGGGVLRTVVRSAWLGGQVSSDSRKRMMGRGFLRGFPRHCPQQVGGLSPFLASVAPWAPSPVLPLSIISKFLAFRPPCSLSGVLPSNMLLSEILW